MMTRVSISLFRKEYLFWNVVSFTGGIIRLGMWERLWN
jgi:hypothetical protein